MTESNDKTYEVIEYVFEFDGGRQERFRLEFDKRSFELQKPSNPEDYPAWTELGFHQCPNCPLNAASHPHCPAAVGLADVIQRFDDVISHDTVRIRVRARGRIIAQRTSAQSAIGSLMGLITASSGCPHSAIFRPMARFHLPVSSEQEVIYRVTSMYLLGQYMRYKESKTIDVNFEGLSDAYCAMQLVNAALAERFRAATQTDSSVNALVLLDAYAQTLPVAIDDSLSEIRYIFSPILHDSEKPSSD